MKKNNALIGIVLIVIGLLACNIDGLKGDSNDDELLIAVTPRFAVGLEQNENANFVLHVLNTGEISPIDIKVYIDNELKLDADLKNGDGSVIAIPPHITINLQLNKGIHKIKAVSIAGEAVFEQGFEVVDKHWAILGYEHWWGIGEETPPKQFGFTIRTDPIYFQ